MKKQMIRISLVGVVVLAGCGPLNMPPQNEYTIAAKKVKYSNRRSRTGKSILVSSTIAAPGFQTRNMIYEQTPYKLQSYSMSQWVAPPANMITSVLVSALRKTNNFKAVAAPPFSGKTDYQLNTNLVALDQSFMRPTSRIHLVLSASLVEAKSFRVLATKTFVKNVDAPGNNAYSGVIAANKAAAWVSRQVARFAANEAR